MSDPRLTVDGRAALGCGRCATQAAIGVFDSGVGGLTVVRSLAERLPREEIVYLGDTARVPYGSKSAETVARYSRNVGPLPVGEGVKMIVVACNTASAYALEVLRAELPVPVLGVDRAGRARGGGRHAQRAASASSARSAPCARGSYARAIAAHRPERARDRARLSAAGAARRGGLARRRGRRRGGAPLSARAARRSARPRRDRARLHALSAAAAARCTRVAASCSAAR